MYSKNKITILYVLQLEDITFTYNNAQDCLDILKNMKNCSIRKKDEIIQIKKNIHITINDIVYEYEDALKKLCKIKSKENIDDDNDLEGYSDISNTNNETDKDEYDDYNVDDSEDDNEYGDIY